QLLSGVISSPSGQKLEGVTVSAKLEDSTITTSVYTDETGRYYFPPMPAGKYRVWAQALGFETAKSSVDLTAARHHDVVLQQMTDPEKRIRQLPSELLAAALPEATPDDARIKRIFINNCTDWSLGPTSKLGELPHDGGMGLDGNLYYTVNNPNRLVSIGKVDGKTGEVSYLKVAASNGEAATSHGLVRDAKGDFWFDIN